MKVCPLVVLIAGMFCITAMEIAAIVTHQDGQHFEMVAGLLFTMATGAPHLPALWTKTTVVPPAPPAQ